MTSTKKTTEKKEAVKKPSSTTKPSSRTSAASKKAAAPKKTASDKKAEQLEHEEAQAVQAAVGGSFLAAVGRRKTSIARVRLIKNGKGLITINGRPYDGYFTTFELRKAVTEPLVAVGQSGSVDVSVKVAGGGIRGQAEASRLGISRALIQLNPTFRKALKKVGFLTRDARKKERKKFGLKKARRAPQWSKR
ncbi:MAG TPA: 30S ribosomal protein S9 [Candidatus Methylomirabilis sp.]|nr:30S ribosomal protein S9 [Candidatus Methylomirabilis sp.]